MGKRGQRKEIRITDILCTRGKGTKVRLPGDMDLWLPTSCVNIQVNDYGERVAVVPEWLYKSKMDELEKKSQEKGR